MIPQNNTSEIKMYSHTVSKRDARYGNPGFFYDSDHCPLKPRKQKTQTVILNELFDRRRITGPTLIITPPQTHIALAIAQILLACVCVCVCVCVCRETQTDTNSLHLHLQETFLITSCKTSTHYSRFTEKETETQRH